VILARTHWFIALAAGLALWGPAGGARADTGLHIDPIQLQLPAEAPSALLLLRNESTEPSRVQLSVFGWEQDADGHMSLKPTNEIVFFPPLLTIAPGESRNIRFGALNPAGPVERNYRLQIDELPPLQKKGSQKSVIATKMRISLPIFVGSTKPATEVSIDKLSLERGLLSFEVKNRGTVHVQPSVIRITGTKPAGAVAYHNDQRGWYILAGGTRAYSLQLAPVDCTRLSSLSIEVPVGGATVAKTLPVDRERSCGR
jgi:fimbrial chaperone protein